MTESSELPINDVPRHVAIIMDGNGRWANRRGKPRISGHRAGVEAVRGVVRSCAGLGIEALTLFAFSTENWKRPASEVGLLMDLFVNALEQEGKRLHGNNVSLRVIGDRSAFAPKLQDAIARVEDKTRENTGLKLVVAANYGGRWDIANAARILAAQVAAGERSADSIDEAALGEYLSLSDLPEPDLFIRSGGEQRISNFLLWQLAYTEFYFTESLWPDFNETEFKKALVSYRRRQRRFGQTGEQVSPETKTG